jgi:hypothetical protein
MLTKSQIVEMLKLQNLMNERVDKCWCVNQEKDWMFASIVEAVEYVEHMGWKDWKKQTPDFNQAKMELVDIFHFALSHCMTDGIDSLQKSFDENAEDIYNEILFSEHRTINNDWVSFNVKESVKYFIEHSVSGLGFSWHFFAKMMGHCELSYNELYKLYIGKNMLNLFRQDNGYQEGYYQKQWLGMEDNVHLTEILKDIKDDDSDIQEQVIYQLQERYNKHLSASAASLDL